ncbi:hypothetical protein [Psychrobacillus sp. OK032]|uniref:hypothetical protein n=1 Tax=Psychrobacillus sp. OK032 TaxID=1884358 RepID=UPI0008D4CC4F|nr:hypothetical protein [Psychrobacillus sp. OK032]SER51748.1 hypothetical protein SAMN05518872_10121 [Psychrobacillus sp. OK032]
MQKKSLTLLGVVLAWIIILSFLFVQSQNTEMTLAESIAETKKEQQKIEALLTKIQQTLDQKDYGEIGLTFSFEGRLLTVQVKNQAFLDQNEKKLKSLINDIVKEKKMDAINIQFEAFNTDSAMSEEDKKLNELIHEVSKITSESMNENGYSINAMMIEPKTSNPSIDIRIDGTKEYYDKVKDDIQQLVSNAVSSNTKINFEVKITRRTENDIREEKWQPIFSAIREETDKKFDEYRGFAYSFHPEPLQIVIKTDLRESKWAWNSNKKAEQIEKYVHEIIELKSKELSVEELPYEVIIRGKDNKRIN